MASEFDYNTNHKFKNGFNKGRDSVGHVYGWTSIDDSWELMATRSRREEKVGSISQLSHGIVHLNLSSDGIENRVGRPMSYPSSVFDYSPPSPNHHDFFEKNVFGSRLRKKPLTNFGPQNLPIIDQTWTVPPFETFKDLQGSDDPVSDFSDSETQTNAKHTKRKPPLSLTSFVLFLSIFTNILLISWLCYTNCEVFADWFIKLGTRVSHKLSKIDFDKDYYVMKIEDSVRYCINLLFGF